MKTWKAGDFWCADVVRVEEKELPPAKAKNFTDLFTFLENMYSSVRKALIGFF